MDELIQPKRGTVGYTRKVSGENPLRQDLKKYESEEISVFVQFDVSNDSRETDALIAEALEQATRAAHASLRITLVDAPDSFDAVEWDRNTKDFLRTLSHERQLTFLEFRKQLGYVWGNGPTTEQRKDIDSWVAAEKKTG